MEQWIHLLERIKMQPHFGTRFIRDLCRLVVHLVGTSYHFFGDDDTMCRHKTYESRYRAIKNRDTTFNRWNHKSIKQVKHSRTDAKQTTLNSVLFLDFGSDLIQNLRNGVINKKCSDERPKPVGVFGHNCTHFRPFG